MLGTDGNIAGGCSTSGWSGKLPGRVGDSPIIGGGLYLDNEVGAAGSTGLGENVMRYCGTFLVVELMRQGLHPQDACLEALRRIRLTHSASELPVILFTGLDAGEAFETAGELGANAWLAKPYQLADLLAAVRGQIASPTVLARTV